MNLGFFVQSFFEQKLNSISGTPFLTRCLVIHQSTIFFLKSTPVASHPIVSLYSNISGGAFAVVPSTDNPNVNVPQSAAMRPSASYPNMQNAFALEDENLRLWQEAVASMAEKRSSIKFKQNNLSSSTATSSSNSSSNSGSAQSSRKSSSSGNDAEKAHSPPLIVPIDDEIKVVEIANSPPTCESLVAISNEDTFPNDNIDDAFDDAESYFEETEVSEQVSESGVNENRLTNISSDSSSDAEIELLELRREAMKSMVEKDKLSLENSVVNNSNSEAKIILQPQKSEKIEQKLDETKRMAENKTIQKSPSQAKLSTIVVEIERAQSVDSLPERKLTIAEFQDSSDKVEEIASNEKASKVKQIDITVDSKNNKTISFNQSSEKIEANSSITAKTSDISKSTLNNLSQPPNSSLKKNNTNLTASVKTLSAKSKSFDQTELKNDPRKTMSSAVESISMQVSKSKVNVSGGILLSNSKNTSAFRKVNSPAISKTAIALTSQPTENPQLSSRKSFPIGSTQLKRRTKRPSVTLSGKVTKPVHKNLFVKSFQTKLVKTNPHVMTRRSSRFSTNKLNISQTNLTSVSRNGKRLPQKNNPFSKVNAKRVNYDCQAPKHPPLVINFGLDLQEELSSDDDDDHRAKEDSIMLASLSDSDVFSQSSSQVEVPSNVLTGKHMTSMLSWTPRNNLVASQDDFTFECKRPQNSKGSLNPFARKKYCGNVCLSTDPFAENIFTRQIGEAELKESKTREDERLKEREVNAISVSDSEISGQFSVLKSDIEPALSKRMDQDAFKQRMATNVSEDSQIADYDDARQPIKITSAENLNNSCKTESKTEALSENTKTSPEDKRVENFEIKVNFESNSNCDQKAPCLKNDPASKIFKSELSSEKAFEEPAKEKSSSHSNIFDIFDNDDELDSASEPVKKQVNNEKFSSETPISVKPRVKIVSPFKFKPLMTEKKVSEGENKAETELNKLNQDKLSTKIVVSNESKLTAEDEDSRVKPLDTKASIDSLNAATDLPNSGFEENGQIVEESTGKIAVPEVIQKDVAECIMPGNLDEMIHNARVSATVRELVSYFCSIL